jgi:hypothetical protein
MIRCLLHGVHSSVPAAEVDEVVGGARRGGNDVICGEPEALLSGLGVESVETFRAAEVN